MKWRLTLTCACTWRVAAAPRLDRPLICPQHGMRSIRLAERIDPDAPDLSGLAAMVAAGRDNS